MEKIVCFMPIRLNSQRIKEKSIIDILGRPMFCHSLETLDQLDIPVYVFTNEIERLKSLVDFKTKNVKWLARPSYLDDHNTKGIDIYREFSNLAKSENYLLTHCTSPFIKLESYKACINAVLKEGFKSSMSVKKEKTFAWMNGSPINFNFPRPKTQDLNPVFIETSAFYCYKSIVLEKNARTCNNPKMIVTKGLENIDIDNPEDLEFLHIKEV